MKNTAEFLRDLIKIPSESTKEKDVVAWIAGEMEELGYDEVFVDDMGSVIGRIGNGPVKILYDSHIDTVGTGDPDAWAFDPYEGKVEDGRIFGRGASDNKAATASMVHGGAEFAESGFTKEVTLYVVGTVQEEDCDGLALYHLINSGTVVPDYVVLGECTGLDVYRGHRGRMEIKITVPGSACHASAPERGENALYKMSRLILEIESLNEKLTTDPFLGKGTVAVTQLEVVSGSLNTVPDRAVCYLDRRLTVGETSESALAELRGLPAAAGGGTEIEVLKYDTPSYTGKMIAIDKYYPTWTIPENHLLVKAGAMAAQKVLGREPEISRWVFSTNGVASMGMLGIPTIGFGPSEEKFAHTVTDNVLISDLDTAREFYREFPGILVELLATGKDSK